MSLASVGLAWQEKAEVFLFVSARYVLTRLFLLNARARHRLLLCTLWQESAKALEAKKLADAQKAEVFVLLVDFHNSKLLEFGLLRSSALYFF